MTCTTEFGLFDSNGDDQCNATAAPRRFDLFNGISKTFFFVDRLRNDNYCYLIKTTLKYKQTNSLKQKIAFNVYDVSIWPPGSL